jgi:hypothetical protein
LEDTALVSFVIWSTNAFVAGKLFDQQDKKFFQKVNTMMRKFNQRNSGHRTQSRQNTPCLVVWPVKLHRMILSPRTQDLGWWDEVNNVGLKAHFIASQLAVPMMLNSSSVRAPLVYDLLLPLRPLVLAYITPRFSPCSTPAFCFDSILSLSHFWHPLLAAQSERPPLIVHVSSAGGLRYIFDVACARRARSRSRSVRICFHCASASIAHRLPLRIGFHGGASANRDEPSSAGWFHSSAWIRELQAIA